MSIYFLTNDNITDEFKRNYKVFSMEIIESGHNRSGTCYTKEKRILCFEVHGKDIIITEIHSDMVKWKGMTWEEFYKSKGVLK